MNHTNITRKLINLALGSLLAFAALSPAVAGNTRSLGHGVKCYYVTTQTGPYSYTHVQVCRKVGV
jgi:hypothetical protein